MQMGNFAGDLESGVAVADPSWRVDWNLELGLKFDEGPDGSCLEF